MDTTGKSLLNDKRIPSSTPYWFVLLAWCVLVCLDCLFSPFTWQRQLPLLAIGVTGAATAVVTLRIIGRAKRDLVEAHKTYRESESRYHAIFENSADAMSLVIDNKVVMGNKKSDDLFGVPHGVHSDVPVWQMAPEIQPDGMTSEAKARKMDQLALEKGVARFDWRGRRLDGTEFDTEITLVRTELGGRPALNVFIRDITEARQLETQLRHSQAQYYELVSSVHEGIGRVDKHEVIQYCNPAYANIFGFARPDDLVGRSVNEFLGKTGSEIRAAQLEVLATGQPVKYEIDVVLKNGEQRRLLVSSTPRFDNDGHFDGTLSAVVEVTDLHRASQEREHLLREKEQRVRELSCLYSVSRLLGQRRDLEAIFRGVVSIIPSGLERGCTAHARIRFGSRDYTTGSFRESAVKMVGEIVIGGHLEGLVEVFLGTDEENCDDHEFRPGEHHLVEAIARTLGQAIEMIRIDQRLQAATNEWKETFNLITDAIIIQDANLETVRVNQAARTMFHAQEHVSAGLQRLLAAAPDAHGDAQKIVRRCIETRKSVHLEVEDTDSEQHYEIQIFPKLQQDGRLDGLVFLITNITGRVLREREKVMWLTAINQSAGMICITDTAGNVEYVNHQFTQMTGYTFEEVAGKPIRLLRSGLQSPEFYKELWDTITSGRTWTGRLQNRRKNGEIYWEYQKITPIRNEHGETVNFLAIKEDVTREMQAAQKIMESDKLAAVGILAAGVAHEFKNYLGGIIGNASFVLDQLDDDEAIDLARQTLSDIITIGEQANQVAMSLLTYSKAGTDQFSRESLRKIIDQTASLVSKGLRSRAIELLIYEEEVREAEIIPGKIQQLLLNLIINAEQAIGKNGVITISLTCDDTFAYLRVGDTGNGIPHDNLSRVFDPFFSTKGVWGKDEVVGSGMGLAICRNVAIEHGGNLTVESLEGIGTTFTLTLPLVRSYNRSRAVGAVAVPSGRFLLFTLDKTVIGRYFAPSSQARTDMVVVDEFGKVTSSVLRSLRLAVLDGRFPAKIELWRMADLCRDAAVPYVVLNCGAKEYQMADMYQNAITCFSNLPEFDRILAAIPEPAATVV